MGSRLVEFVILLAILSAAAVFRWSALDWDAYRHFHPDERYITWVATTIEPPASFAGAFSPDQSSFNPFYWSPTAESPGIVVPQDEQRAFAYGHFPLYLGVAATKLAEWAAPNLILRLPAEWLLTQDILNAGQWIEYAHLTAVARALTGLFDLGTIVLIYLLGRRLYGTAVGLIAAAFLAFNVMHIQLAHFFISDPYLTFFIVAAIFCWVAAFQVVVDVSPSHPPTDSVGGSAGAARRSAVWFWGGCMMSGFAIGSKFAAIILFAPMLVAVLGIWQKRWLPQLLLGVGITYVTFFLTNPFAILDLSCELISPATHIGPLRIPALDWRSCYLDNIFTQRAMVSGASDLPFTRQYSGTTPYLYYIEMQLRWGMGPLLGLAAFAGFGWGVWQLGSPLWQWLKTFWQKRRTQQHIRLLRRLVVQNPAILILAWCIPYFISTGAFFVKFMRYMQPLVPFLMLYGAAMLWRWTKRPFWRNFVLTTVLLSTIAFATAFLNMYRLPHPWVVASGWIYTNVPADTLVLSEKWDDTLPTNLTMGDTYRRRSEYQNQELTWLTKTGSGDDEAKLMVNLALLAEAEYVTVVSNRIYGVVSRLPERYPISSQYYPLLFDGSLGYEPVFVFERNPNLAGWSFQPDTFTEPNLTPPPFVQGYLDSKRAIPWGRADESFTVYDQALTIIFENKGQLTVDEMRELFEVDN